MEAVKEWKDPKDMIGRIKRINKLERLILPLRIKMEVGKDIWLKMTEVIGADLVDDPCFLMRLFRNKIIIDAGKGLQAVHDDQGNMTKLSTLCLLGGADLRSIFAPIMLKLAGNRIQILGAVGFWAPGKVDIMPAAFKLMITYEKEKYEKNVHKTSSSGYLL